MWAGSRAPAAKKMCGLDLRAQARRLLYSFARTMFVAYPQTRSCVTHDEAAIVTILFDLFDGKPALEYPGYSSGEKLQPKPGGEI